MMSWGEAGFNPPEIQSESLPVGAEPTTEAVGVVAAAEVVVAGFGVALLAFEFVVLRAGVGVGALAAVGIEIGVITNDASVRGDDAGSAGKVVHIIDRSATSGKHDDALAPKENVFGSGVAGGVGFRKDFAAGAVPIEF